MENGKLVWHTEKRKVKDLKLFEGNPRRMTEEQAEQLLTSLKKFNLVEIPAIDQDNRVVAGNMRIMALKKLGREEEEIEVRVPNRPLTEEEAREYLLRSNKNVGEWDWDMLSNFDEDFLKKVGFSNSELDKVFQIDKPSDDDLPEVRETDIKYGDIFQLGDHRLMCGDSLLLEDVEKLMNGEKADLGFTSPPYWVGKEYEREKSVEEINEFIRKAAKSYDFAVKKDRSRIIINTGTGFTTSFEKIGKRNVLLLIDKWANAFNELGWYLRHIRHWLKEGYFNIPRGISPKTDLIDQHSEFIGTFEHSLGEELDFKDIIEENKVYILETFYNPMGKTLGQNKTNTSWALRSYWDDIRGTAKEAGHCASFPVELVERHLVLYTKRGALVLDLFGGAGTTMIACEKLKRRCYMMEIEPKYCQLIIDRWEQFSGKKAVKV